MFKGIFPETSKRVRMYTEEYVNEKIDEKTVRDITKYVNKSDEEILNRIGELDEEWDTERTLETSAAALTLTGVVLGLTTSKKWFLLSGITGGFLLQHALQGWCPSMTIIRRLGVRTSSEIEEEKCALKSVLERRG